MELSGSTAGLTGEWARLGPPRLVASDASRLVGRDATLDWRLGNIGLSLVVALEGV